MKAIILCGLFLAAFSTWAQEEKTILVGETQYTFTGTRVYHNVDLASEYYHIEDGILYRYTIGYTNYEKATFQTCQVALENLDFKSASYSDMNTGETLPYEAFMLSIDTRKLKDNVKCDMRTAFDPSPGIDMVSSIDITCPTKREAEALFNKIKAAAGK